MAKEFDRQTTPDPMSRVTPAVAKPSSSMMPYAIAAAVAVALALGMMFWNSDRNTAGVNTTPGLTTGSSSTASPSNPPPAPGIQQGQGQSNSTR